MPKTPIDYSNTSIYKLVCKDINITETYVGSTTNFTKRKANHKSDCYNQKKMKYNYPVYSFIRDNGGFDNWSMIEIENASFKDSNEAKKRERYWIETLKATLNKQIPARTLSEYWDDNKEELTVKRKVYLEENKERIYEQQRQYGRIYNMGPRKIKRENKKKRKHMMKTNKFNMPFVLKQNKFKKL